MIVQLESLTLQTGVGGSPFDLDPTKYKWMKHSWWTNTLTSMRKYNITIIGQVQMLNLWAENDSFLMEDMQRIYNTTRDRATLQSINRVHLFLQVNTQSDIQLSCRWKSKDEIFNPIDPIQCISHTYYQ